MLKKTFFLLVGLVLVNSWVWAERIFAPPVPDRAMVQVEVHGDECGLMPMEANLHSDDYYKIVARRGERFRLVIRNRSDRRLAMVISIDGLNIVSGKTSYHRPDESMYLLEPGQTGSFDGWRTSYTNVQRFYFTDQFDSYAARTGQTGQLGWIKVAVFKERQPLIVSPKRYSDSSERAMLESPQAGTGYGESHYSPVTTADFKPESFPVQMVRIKYDFAPVKYHQPGFADPPPDY